MSDMTQVDKVMRYADLIQKQMGRAVRPYHEDGYVNMMNRYGTQKDTSEHYQYVPEGIVPDEVLTMYYESNGLFAKIIDAPAEEAVKHGFELEGVTDQKILDFMEEALEELDWEEVAMQSIKWARLFGGSIAVMLINDGRGLEEPVDWKNVRSIDDIRVYDRSLIQPDYGSMYNYDPTDPFGTRGSRLGMPEYYQVFSKYGNFVVHDSRCLVFQNGVLPENTSNSVYELWGIPEYVRLNKAIQDAEVAHRSAPKLLDRSVQPVYKMKDLAIELATEEGEDRVLKRLQVIDTARGVLNSLVIDADGEDYDFKTFQFTGVNDVISASCNMLSAISNIPQVILFGSPVGGLSTADDTAMENYYNYVERIQKRMLKSNLRYLLSVIFQAGMYTEEIDEIPTIRVKFSPLWSVSDSEQADMELKQVQIQQARAQVAETYVNMQVIDPTEVRKKLADSDEFDVETMLDEYDEEELKGINTEVGSATGADPMAAMMGGAQAADPASAMMGGAAPAEGESSDMAALLSGEAEQPAENENAPAPEESAESSSPEKAAEPAEPVPEQAAEQPESAAPVATSGTEPAEQPVEESDPYENAFATLRELVDEVRGPKRKKRPPAAETPGTSVKAVRKLENQVGVTEEDQDPYGYAFYLLRELLNERKEQQKKEDRNLEALQTAAEERKQAAEYEQGVSTGVHKKLGSGRASAAAPEATKLPEDMDDEEENEDERDYQNEGDNEMRAERPNGVGVVVVKDGRVLCGTRHNGGGYGLLCGPGGNIEPWETPEQAAMRETEEEFGIIPLELMPLGYGPAEEGCRCGPRIYLCTDYEGEPECLDLEMTKPEFRTIGEIKGSPELCYAPFIGGVDVMLNEFGYGEPPARERILRTDKNAAKNRR